MERDRVGHAGRALLGEKPHRACTAMPLRVNVIVPAPASTLTGPAASFASRTRSAAPAVSAKAPPRTGQQLFALSHEGGCSVPGVGFTQPLVLALGVLALHAAAQH